MKTQSLFEPGAAERYLDAEQLGQRWQCNPRTVPARARKLGVPILLLGGSVRFPLSEILRIEQAAVALYQNRKTECPAQFAKAPPPKRGPRGPYRVRIAGRAIDAEAIAN
jgi:hypothetical protein